VIKQILFILILTFLNGCSSAKIIEKPSKSVWIEHKQINQSFQDVWNQVVSDPVITLPQETVSFFKLFNFKKDIILEDSKRTLQNHADILEPFNKLAHPNGICFKGIWEITKENPYSGYFKNTTKALIIARASSAMSNTKSGETRAFGLAGKIFPTLNPNKINSKNTANFFLIDDLGGTKAEHFMDVALTNEPDISTTSAVIKNLLYALKVASSFKEADANPTIRQLYEISYLGEKNNNSIITPKWMKVEAKSIKRVDAKDFRHELNISDGKKLIFNIFVASNQVDNKKDWKKIGTMTFDTSIVSKSCDHRLHFHHPKWRDDLRYR